MTTQRLPNGTRVRMDIAQGLDRCEGVIADAEYDDGWLYRIEVAAGDPCDTHREDNGDLWVCDFEVSPMGPPTGGEDDDRS